MRPGTDVDSGYTRAGAFDLLDAGVRGLGASSDARCLNEDLKDRRPAAMVAQSRQPSSPTGGPAHKAQDHLLVLGLADDLDLQQPFGAALSPSSSGGVVAAEHLLGPGPGPGVR
jgi:hypothetical protein